MWHRVINNVVNVRYRDDLKRFIKKDKTYIMGHLYIDIWSICIAMRRYKGNRIQFISKDKYLY